MNIVKRELRANLKPMLIWALSIAFLVIVWMVEYKSFADNPAINEFMDALPQTLLSVLGMQDFTLTNLNGFIGSISLYLYLLLGVQAVLLGSFIISKEESDKTGEYLFSLPITRERVIVAKIIAATINLLFINIIALFAMLTVTMNYDKAANFYSFISLTFLALFIVQMIFLSVGMFVASVNKRHKKSGNISVSILMATFLIASLINMVDKLDFLKCFTPFKYFETAYIQKHMSLEPVFIIISIVIIIIGISSTLIYYPKRDLYI
ncbi:MAG: ABC transporter permease subunit [Erysipelothrix sp.]|nr:ABC transporter permease subunit [Erysipelothrix sp.]